MSRVLFVFAGRAHGGAENYVLDIAAACAARNWRTHAAWPMTPQTSALKAAFLEHGCAVHRFPACIPEGGPVRQRLGHLAEAARMLLLLGRVRPDAVLFTLSWPDQLFGAMLAAAASGCAYSVTFQAAPNRMDFGPRRLRLYSSIWSRARALIAVSDSARGDVSAMFHIGPDKFTVIRNGFRRAFLTTTVSKDERSDFRRGLDIPQTAPLAVTVGRVSRHKGAFLLVQAVAALSAAFPDLHVLFAGDDDETPQVSELASRLGVRGRVRFLGRRSDVPRLLRMADLFVFPSLFEGMPFALLEAMASGLPCVASDLPCIREVMRHGIDGLCCQTGDASSLAQAMAAVLSDKPMSERLARSAAERSLLFTADRMVEQTLGLLDAHATR